MVDLQSKLPQECLDTLRDELLADQCYNLSTFTKLPEGQAAPKNHWYFYFISGVFRRPGDTLPRQYPSNQRRSARATRQIYCLPRRGLNEILYTTQFGMTTSSTIHSTVRQLLDNKGRQWTCQQMRTMGEFDGWGDERCPVVKAEIFITSPKMGSLQQLVARQIISRLPPPDLVRLIGDRRYLLSTFLRQDALPLTSNDYWYVCCFVGHTLTYEGYLDYKITKIFCIPTRGYNQRLYFEDRGTVLSTLGDITQVPQQPPAHVIFNPAHLYIHRQDTNIFAFVDGFIFRLTLDTKIYLPPLI